MAQVKWIKIVTDIFDDEKVLLIESMPEADSIIVIWFKLLCLAGKQNNKGIFMLNDRIAYTDEMLASIFRRPLNTVRLALNTFQAYGMIEIVDNVITIPNWDKHQSLDALERKKEYDRQYQAKKRLQQKLLIEEKNRTISNDDSTTVVSLEEDKDKELDKDIDNKESNINIAKEIISYLNSKTNKSFKSNNKETIKHINARLKEGYTINDFKKVIDIKTAEWLNTNMDQYLRPQTLFNSKFESYLNTKPNTLKKDNTSVQTQQEPPVKKYSFDIV